MEGRLPPPNRVSAGASGRPGSVFQTQGLALAGEVMFAEVLGGGFDLVVTGVIEGVSEERLGVDGLE